MTGVRVIVDDREVIEGLRRLRARVGDLLRAHDPRFDAQRAPDGTSWVPLNPRYAARKAKRRPRAGILELDGHLRRLA